MFEGLCVRVVVGHLAVFLSLESLSLESLCRSGDDGLLWAGPPGTSLGVDAWGLSAVVCRALTSLGMTRSVLVGDSKLAGDWHGLLVRRCGLDACLAASRSESCASRHRHAGLGIVMLVLGDSLLAWFGEGAVLAEWARRPCGRVLGHRVG